MPLKRCLMDSPPPDATRASFKSSTLPSIFNIKRREPALSAELQATLDAQRSD